MTRNELLRIAGLPVLQNRVYESASSAHRSPKGNMVLVQDQATGLVFNSAFDPGLLTYDADYQNEQACSSVFRRHLDEVLSSIGRHFRTPSLIEVGCGVRSPSSGWSRTSRCPRTVSSR